MAKESSLNDFVYSSFYLEVCLMFINEKPMKQSQQKQQQDVKIRTKSFDQQETVAKREIYLKNSSESIKRGENKNIKQFKTFK